MFTFLENQMAQHRAEQVAHADRIRAVRDELLRQVPRPSAAGAGFPSGPVEGPTEGAVIGDDTEAMVEANGQFAPRPPTTTELE